MTASVGLCSPTRNRQWMWASSTSASSGQGRRVSFQRTTRGGLREGDQCQRRGGVQWRGPYQYEFALPRPAAPQRLRLPTLNYKYDWLRPKLVTAYMNLHNKESRESDI